MADPRQVTKSFTIMGSSFVPGAGTLIDRLRPNQPLKLEREPNNPHDKNAVLVKWGDRRLGWVPRGLAADIAPHMDSGTVVICRKAPPLPKFGAFRGILELAYIPAEPARPASEAADAASAEGQVSDRIPTGENMPDDFDE